MGDVGKGYFTGEGEKSDKNIGMFGGTVSFSGRANIYEERNLFLVFFDFDGQWS
jgi:hypothetical protein